MNLSKIYLIIEYYNISLKATYKQCYILSVPLGFFYRQIHLKNLTKQVQILLLLKLKALSYTSHMSFCFLEIFLEWYFRMVFL